MTEAQPLTDQEFKDRMRALEAKRLGPGLTAHALARLLLDGPDLPVAYFNHDDQGDYLVDTHRVESHREACRDLVLLVDDPLTDDEDRALAAYHRDLAREERARREAEMAKADLESGEVDF